MEIDKRKLEMVIEELRIKNTPLPGNICHCGGRVVRKVVSFSFCRGFSYGLPACEKCKRIYLHAENVPKEGEKDFLEIINTPMTI